MQASVTLRRCTTEPLHRLVEGTAGFAAAALLVLGTTLTPMASAQLFERSIGLDTSGDPKSELAACNSGKTAQDRATCVREVRRAQAARRSGKLENYGDYKANALKRCEVFKNPVDLEACRERVLQPDIREGSVIEGGILRGAEVVVTVPPSSTTPANTRTPGSATTPGTSTTPDTPVAPTPGSNGSTTTPDSPMAPGSTMSPGSSQTMPETTPPPATR